MNNKYKVALIGNKWYIIRINGYTRILCSPYRDPLDDICKKLNTNNNYTESDAQIEYDLMYKIEL